MKATAASTPNTNHHILDLDPLRITGSKNYFVSTLHITIPQGKNIENIHAKIELRSETTKKKKSKRCKRQDKGKKLIFLIPFDIPRVAGKKGAGLPETK